jgi:DNA-binding winged helix-turn-helix (wHTH) protein
MTEALDPAELTNGNGGGPMIDLRTQAGSKLLINLRTRAVHKGGTQIDLSAKQFLLLLTFASDPGRVFTVDELKAIVWAKQPLTTDDTVRGLILELRRKIGKELIRSVSGGYMLDASREPFGADRAIESAEPGREPQFPVAIVDLGDFQGATALEQEPRAEPSSSMAWGLSLQSTFVSEQPPGGTPDPRLDGRRLAEKWPERLRRARKDYPMLLAVAAAVAVAVITAGWGFWQDRGQPISPPQSWNFAQGMDRWGEHPEFQVPRIGLGVEPACEQPLPAGYNGTCTMKFSPTAPNNNSAYVSIPDVSGRLVKVDVFVPDQAETCTPSPPSCATARVIVWDAVKVSHEGDYVELHPGRMHTLTFDGRRQPVRVPWSEIGIHFHLADYSGPFYIAKVEVWE